MSRRPARGKFLSGAVEHLRTADPVLRELIDRIGHFDPPHEPDLWRSLIDAIAGQQLSVRAADAIVHRIAALAPDDRFPSAGRILHTSEEDLRACGLSRPKIRYIKDLARQWTDGTLHPERLPHLPDDELITALTRVKGIGRWTAEMVLIFTLQRPDVLPTDDLGLRTAAQRAYALPERPAKAELLALGERWRPFRSVATLYLWRSLGSPSGLERAE